MNLLELGNLIKKEAPLLGSLISSAHPIAGLLINLIANYFKSNHYDLKDVANKIENDNNSATKLKQIEDDHQYILLQTSLAEKKESKIIINNYFTSSTQ